MGESAPIPGRLSLHVRMPVHNWGISPGSQHADGYSGSSSFAGSPNHAASRLASPKPSSPASPRRLMARLANLEPQEATKNKVVHLWTTISVDPLICLNS